MGKSIIIIGAGMGGLASGIYGQLNGYKTRIFEMHSVPGGQCAAYKRKGYTFDVCIHHLFGCSPQSKINMLWRELGAMPRELVYTKECVSVSSPNGKMFIDYYDLERLEQHLKELSPGDAKVIDEYTRAIAAFSKSDMWGKMMLGSTWSMISVIPFMLSSGKWFKTSMRQYAERFTDPFLKKAFPLLEYSEPNLPFFIHLAKHAYGYNKDIAWPAGGAFEFARSIERRYRELGGEVFYQQKVVKIITENDRAVGVQTADGSEHRADLVISNADGRKTIMDMLGGRYLNDRVRAYCGEPQDETNWAVHVFLGVDRDLSGEPSSLVMLLDEPVEIAGHVNESIEMQFYGFDKTMAPAGKGVIKVELVSSYSYWKKLYSDRALYGEEKEKVAETVISLLEKRFPGIKSQVEAVDVPTLMTWERYMGGTHGFANMPVKKFSISGSLFSRGLETTLPGLSNFHLVGVWVTSAGALFANALSGRTLMKSICKNDGKKFRSA
ncbi:phytoene desaturase family protein [Pelotomaculum propionicicum]|uniref:phytoene desaturase family protein n=1 Tax=Pelotomaculum propionicicum TaxID=258475 RepID=UPI003B7664E9